MRYLITILAILLSTSIVYGQSDARISIGERGNKYALTQPINEKISAAVLKEHPKLHVTGGSNTMNIVGQYDVSVK